MTNGRRTREAERSDFCRKRGDARLRLLRSTAATELFRPNLREFTLVTITLFFPPFYSTLTPRASVFINGIREKGDKLSSLSIFTLLREEERSKADRSPLPSSSALRILVAKRLDCSSPRVKRRQVYTVLGISGHRVSRVFPFVSSAAFDRVIRWNGCVLMENRVSADLESLSGAIIGQPCSHTHTHRAPIERTVPTC